MRRLTVLSTRPAAGVGAWSGHAAAPAAAVRRSGTPLVSGSMRLVPAALPASPTVGARGLRIPRVQEDWYNQQHGKPHPGAEYPWGVRRIWPESWVRPPRGSLFPLVPEPRNGETVESFLTKIKLADHAAKFSSWEELFTTKTRAMRAKGIKKSKDRRLILSWVEKYRQGVDPGTCKYLLYYKKN